MSLCEIRTSQKTKQTSTIKRLVRGGNRMFSTKKRTGQNFPQTVLANIQQCLLCKLPHTTSSICTYFQSLPSRSGHPCLGKCDYKMPILLIHTVKWLLQKLGDSKFKYFECEPTTQFRATSSKLKSLSQYMAD